MKIDRATISKAIGILIALASAAGFTEYRASGLSDEQKIDIAILQAQMDTACEILEERFGIKVRVDPSVLKGAMKRMRESASVSVWPAAIAQEEPPEDWPEYEEVDVDVPDPREPEMDPDEVFRQKLQDIEQEF